MDRHRWLTRIIPPHASVIEVGCGTGLSLAGLPQTIKVGIDFSPDMIRIAQQSDATSTYLVDDALSSVTARRTTRALTRHRQFPERHPALLAANPSAPLPRPDADHHHVLQLSLAAAVPDR